MQKKTPAAVPSYSANDNGPLSSGQVKALKIAIAVMSFLIVAALVAIVGRVIYLASTKASRPPASAAAAVVKMVPQTKLALPAGARIKQMSLNGGHVLVYYETDAGPAVAIVDMASGETVSRMDITIGAE